jgi:hypothetical protein
LKRGKNKVKRGGGWRKRACWFLKKKHPDGFILFLITAPVCKAKKREEKEEEENCFSLQLWLACQARFRKKKKKKKKIFS